MRKAWLMRRPVRSPLSRADDRRQAVRRCAGCLSSALRRGPRGRAATAFSAAAWLCGASMISRPPRSMPAALAISAILRCRPDQDRDDQFLLPGLDGAGQRGCLARVRHRRRHRREIAAPLQERFVFAGSSCCLFHVEVSCPVFRGRLSSRRAGHRDQGMGRFDRTLTRFDDHSRRTTRSKGARRPEPVRFPQWIVICNDV